MPMTMPLMADPQNAIMAQKPKLDVSIDLSPESGPA
jgi:hypothetical protein